MGEQNSRPEQAIKNLLDCHRVISPPSAPDENKRVYRKICGLCMHYLLETDYFVEPIAYRTSSLVTEFKFKASRWITGKVMNDPKQPIKVEFWQNGGNGLAEMFHDSIPLFSKELVQALQSAGVNNLQTFPVSIVEREGLDIDQEYLAVNIVGCIKCVDMNKSEHTDIAGQQVFAFRQLVIDETKTQGQLMFRLAESLTSIIVHEKVKTYLDKQNFKYLSFRGLSG